MLNYLRKVLGARYVILAETSPDFLILSLSEQSLRPDESQLLDRIAQVFRDYGKQVELLNLDRPPVFLQLDEIKERIRTKKIKGVLVMGDLEFEDQSVM